MGHHLRYKPNIFFGEVYGPVQKGYTYDSGGKLKLIIFDIFSLNESKYLDWANVIEICYLVDLPVVPILYEGPWFGLDVHKFLAEDESVLAIGLLRERPSSVCSP